MSLRRMSGTLLRRLVFGLGAVIALVVAVRAIMALTGPELRPWHLVVPPELDAAALDATDWAGFMAAEARAFAAVREKVTDRLEAADRVPANRYFADSPLNPSRFATDWNRSFVLLPEGTPRGAAVLLHGMTDAPFSMRHLAQLYRERGWIAVVPRMPGHGTVPAGLTEVHWRDWLAATRLAMREARARLGPDRPIHLVGYSNGGALALKHAMDAIEDPRLPRAEAITLVSPMIGVTAFARFAGIAGLPAFLPAFANAAWLDLAPEFNPFKFNSFPVNAARQSHLLTAALQDQTRRLAAANRLSALPPVLTFQSVVDSTVSTRAVVDALYARLPENGSELVLFDVNRNARLGPLLSPAAVAAVDRLLPEGPRRYQVTIVTNAAPEAADAVARRSPPGAAAGPDEPLGLAWPRQVFSLSHIALPFPVTDGLYGLEPDPEDRQGFTLGALAARGETGVLTMSLDGLLRISSNPFFPYMRARMAERIATPR
ncbi:alpha/beta hydrolase [Falsiroseomonas oryziterrae]|uniref:alpha/beta hydrolase n=1 Tax=Falsiroseomonas oryziterrae TaxID=2911368 RepID=UPI001F22E856|nr:alpha/beta hydrolase [Roseomonas sp. NPKOSM-4]